MGKRLTPDATASSPEAGSTEASLAQPEPEGGTDVADYTRREGATANGQELNALLGRGSEFDGKLSFEGTVRIDGNFSGEISTTDTLIVGEGARVQAEITCGSLIVHGDVIGNVRASESIELHKPAKLEGDISTPSLTIERGVIFRGAAKMDDAAASSNLVRFGSPQAESAAEA